MGWPQWTWIVLVAIGWVINLCNHGQPKEGKHDIGITTTALGISIFLLWQGGFFADKVC